MKTIDFQFAFRYEIRNDSILGIIGVGITNGMITHILSQDEFQQIYITNLTHYYKINDEMNKKENTFRPQITYRFKGLLRGIQVELLLPSGIIYHFETWNPSKQITVMSSSKKFNIFNFSKIWDKHKIVSYSCLPDSILRGFELYFDNGLQIDGICQPLSKTPELLLTYDNDQEHGHLSYEQPEEKTFRNYEELLVIIVLVFLLSIVLTIINYFYPTIDSQKEKIKTEWQAEQDALLSSS